MNGRRRTSLQYLLPLLIITLLLVTVGAAAALAYREVYRSALEAAEERLERVSTQLSMVIQSAVEQALDRQERSAAEPAVLAALERGRPTPEAVGVLGRVGGGDQPVELWDAAGGVVIALGSYPEGWDDRDRMESRSRALPGRRIFGPIHVLHGTAFVWATVPVLDSLGHTRGSLLQMSTFESGTAEQIGALIGEIVQVHLTNVDGGLWVTLQGEVRLMTGGAPLPLERVSRIRDEEGRAYLASASVIGAEPLAVVAESLEEAILARPAIFLRRTMVFGSLLLVVGAVLAWLVSRRITRPLRILSGAASDVAAGDYSRRARIDSNDELSDLAEAFNHMASEVQQAHAELGAQYASARDLAIRLETSNQRIVEAMLAADEARAAAERANMVKSDFLATMSHEIRTPINAIVGYADLLQLQISGPLNQEQRSQLGRLGRSSRHLLRLVDEVLDLARAEAGDLELVPAAASPSDTVRAAFHRIAADAAEKGLRVSLPDAFPEEFHYHGDPRRVEQILVNLLSNAVKFTPSGGDVDIEVCFDAGADPETDGWVDFVVSDNGIGIEQDRHEMIFDPFVQVDGGLTREHGGAGLGLALSRRLARMMGGDVLVESRRGAGSRFTLRLPLAGAGATESA